MLRIARILVLTAAVAAPAVFFGGEKVVHLDVEGRVTPVRTYASSAPDLLRRIGMAPGAKDLVEPNGRLEPGAVVTVRTGKPVQLLIDGKLTTVWVHALTVGGALDELGLSPGDRDFVFPAPQSPVVTGMQVVLRNAMHATLTVDGRRRDAVTTALTVGDLLRQAGIRLGPHDRTVPSTGTVMAEDMHIRVVRVTQVVKEQRLQIPFTHRKRPDPRLEKGLHRLVQDGAEGVKVRRYAVLLEDGKTVDTTFLGEKVVRKPRDEIMAVGTGQPAFRGSGHADSGIASWYQFEGLGAAHRTLPFGTVAKVTNLDNGKTVNVVIRDRGPFVDGRIIDLSDTAFSQVAPLSQGTARVKIEW